MGFLPTVDHATNLFSVFVDSDPDSDPDSKIWDSKMSGLDSRKKLLDWTHYRTILFSAEIAHCIITYCNQDVMN